MHSVWIVCAQTVRKYSYKPVGVYPLNPHGSVNKFLATRLLPPSTLLTPRFVRDRNTQLYTTKNQKITDRNAQLYPLSTLPIITITTYINRRGTAA
jgi:hypothetical protein